MNAKHTDAILIACPSTERGDAPGVVHLCYVEADGVITKLPVTEANVARLAGAWNACHGIKTELLQKHPQDISRAMREQRDQLADGLRDLKHARNWYDGNADAALAEVEHRVGLLLQAVTP